MSRDYRHVCMERALEYGVPFAHRVGRVVVICTAVHRQLDGSLRGSVDAREWPSAGAAAQFVRRAVSESGWKAAGVTS